MPHPNVALFATLEPALSGAEGCRPEPIKKRGFRPEGLGRLPRKPPERDCHPDPERSRRGGICSSPVEENNGSSSTLRNNSVSHLILGGAVLYSEENPTTEITPRIAMNSRNCRVPILARPFAQEPATERSRRGGIPQSPPSRDFLEPYDRKSGNVPSSPHVSRLKI